MNTSSSSDSSCPPAEPSDVSSDTGSESGTNDAHIYNDPKRTIEIASDRLKDYIQPEVTNFSKEKGPLLHKLFRKGNIVHGRLSKPIQKLISKTVLRRVKAKLSEGGKFHLNNITWSLQIKNDPQFESDRDLCLDNTMNEVFPEFIRQSVVDLLTNIDYVDEKDLWLHATLTLKNGRGTDHPDQRMKFRIRIIFTFMLKDGKLHKQFCLRHPVHSNGEQQGFRVYTHEFVILDPESCGGNDPRLTHQAIAADCEVFTIVATLRSEKVPANAAEFMKDLIEANIRKGLEPPKDLSPKFK